MKKLLILMLVLGMVSTASAAFDYGNLTVGGATSVVKGSTAVITVSASVTDPWTAFVDDSTWASGGAVTAVTATAKAGQQAGVTLQTNGYAYRFQTVDNTPADLPNVETGLQWNITIDDGGLDITDTFVVYFYEDDYTTTWDSVTVHVTPEPMTIALFGLGGLFLRRRK
jgi:hypothetical protein